MKQNDHLDQLLAFLLLVLVFSVFFGLAVVAMSHLFSGI